jgi:membrane-associated phospholipid phosphatase
MVYAFDRREVVDRVLVLYLLGTLTAYALFPYFPSAPPRTVFPGMDLPKVVTPFREFNLWLLGGYGIHSSVFPSAHVSSAFAAAWALMLFLPERNWLSWGMLIYAMSVAIATVYGRYHYVVDVAAGVGVSLVAALMVRRQTARISRLPHKIIRTG